MAAPVTHLVLANKFIGSHDLAAYFVGTSFADIRRLGNIPRETVHFQRVSKSDIVDTNSFIAGLKFHSLVDIVRGAYVEANHLLDLFPDSQFSSEALKLFEDRILYSQFSDWKKLPDYFAKICPEELTYGVSESNIKIWHGLLSDYFQSDISDDQIRHLILGNGTPAAVVDEILRVTGQVKDYQKARDSVLNFYNNFEALVEYYLINN